MAKFAIENDTVVRLDDAAVLQCVACFNPTHVLFWHGSIKLCGPCFDTEIERLRVARMERARKAIENTA